MKKRTAKGYGWIPDLPDARDLKYRPGITGSLRASLSPIDIPTDIDLRATGFLPPVYDQGEEGSCGAHALEEMFHFVDMKQIGLSFMGSRNFIYYNARDIGGTADYDSGIMLRDGIKSIVTQGVCMETLWAYDPANMLVKPTDDCYTQAAQHEATVYRSVDQTASDIESCLAEGYPVAVGISVYDSFESDAVAQSGVVPMPSSDEGIVGGHAVLLVGAKSDNTYIMMNSWGADWGMDGFFTIPKSYILSPDMADSFWMVHAVSDQSSA